MAVHGLVILICFTVMALYVLLFGFLLPRRRSRNLERKAREMGFIFAGTAKPFMGTDVSGFSPLADGSETVVYNLLECRKDNCRFLIFDVPIMDDSARLVTTMAAFQLRGIRLPVFQVGAKNAVEKMVERAGSSLGKRVVEFSPDEKFATRFFVHCLNQGETRAFLSPEKITYLREHAGHYHVDSSPEWLFIYCPSRKVEIHDLQHFAEVTSAIASALLSQPTLPFPAAA